MSIAGQTRFPGHDLVAHCVNALPLRRAVSMVGSFSDHLATTQAAFLDAFDHQDFSYGAIVRSSRARREHGRPPLTSIIFNMDSPSQPLDMDGAVAVPGSNPRHSETFDVFLNVVPRGDALVIECTYNVDLFDAATIDRRLDEWMALLSDLRSAGPAVPVGELGIVPAAELELLAQWNATGVERDERRDAGVAVPGCGGRPPGPDRGRVRGAPADLRRAGAHGDADRPAPGGAGRRAGSDGRGCCASARWSWWPRCTASSWPARPTCRWTPSTRPTGSGTWSRRPGCGWCWARTASAAW